MNPMDIFVGVPQSKYAGIAILVALIIVAFAMLFGKEQVPVGQKFLFVLIMFIVALPSILFTLFQLTCLVTGAGMKNQRWWCTAYAWIGSIFIILYSVIIVVVGIASLVNGSNVMYDLNNALQFEEKQNMANSQAAEYFQNVDLPKKENPLAQSMSSGPDTSAMAPFTIGPTAATEHANKPTPAAHFTVSGTDKVATFTVAGKESFQSDGSIPPYVPPESESDRRAREMTAAANNAPAASTPSSLENFANIEEQQKQEYFQGGIGKLFGGQ